jgi:hypothetical protein
MFRLSFPYREGPPDSLELMVGHTCALLEIDGAFQERPRTSPLRTPENQNQDVGGVKRVEGGAVTLRCDLCLT